MTFYNLNLIIGKRLCQKNSVALVIPIWVLPHSIWHTQESIPHTATAVSTPIPQPINPTQKHQKNTKAHLRVGFFLFDVQSSAFFTKFFQIFKNGYISIILIKHRVCAVY